MSFRFVFMADCQLGCYASFSGMTDEDVARYAANGMVVRPVPPVRGWEWDLNRLTAAIEVARSLEPAFVAIGGDMVDDPAVEGQYRDLRDVLTSLDEIPVHFVPGNHDAAFDFVVPTHDSLEAYRERFGADQYTFNHEDVAFVVVNTVVWDHPEQVPDELERQLEFLESALADARDARHILVFGHHPLFTHAPDEPDSYWNIPAARRHPVLRLLKSFGARAFFCGHWHRNGGGWDDGLEVVVTGAVGYPLGPDPSGFRVIDVRGDTVDHHYVALDAVTATERG